MNILDSVKGKLIVSCQALKGEPLYGEGIMSKMALAAQMGGASGIRAQGVTDILDIKKTVNLPVIGIIKKSYEDSEVFITPTMNEVEELLSTKCEMIALDATNRSRPNGEKIEDLLFQIHKNNILAMADISTLEEGIAAQEIGFDCVSTTLSGYTEYSPQIPSVDLKLIRDLVEVLHIPVIAEGKIHSPDDLKEVYRAGAYSAVVGGAITRPMEITERYIQALKEITNI